MTNQTTYDIVILSKQRGNKKMSIDPLTDEELRDIIISELNKTREGNSMYLSKWVKEALFAVLFFILAVILLMALQQENDYKKDAEAFVIY